MLCGFQDAKIKEFAEDATRFISSFAGPISQSVPHIYLSALPFAPSSSSVSENYLPQFPQILQVQRGKALEWPVMRHVLEGHCSPVTSVAFSPNGKQIVSGLDDHTIRVWDAQSGNVILGPLEGHT